MEKLLDNNGAHLEAGWKLSLDFKQALEPVMMKYIDFGCSVSEVQAILFAQSYACMHMLMFTDRNGLSVGKDKTLTDHYQTEPSVAPQSKTLYDNNLKNQAAMNLCFDFDKAIYGLVRAQFMAGQTPQDIIFILLAVNHELFTTHAFSQRVNEKEIKDKNT